MDTTLLYLRHLIFQLPEVGITLDSWNIRLLFYTEVNFAYTKDIVALFSSKLNSFNSFNWLFVYSTREVDDKNILIRVGTLMALTLIFLWTVSFYHQVSLSGILLSTCVIMWSYPDIQHYLSCPSGGSLNPVPVVLDYFFDTFALIACFESSTIKYFVT